MVGAAARRPGVPAGPLEGGRLAALDGGRDPTTGVAGARGRGAVPVGADKASRVAPHDAQNRA
jgi:hypothetical protein